MICLPKHWCVPLVNGAPHSNPASAIRGMASGDEYRCKALELCERANEEQELEVRREFESVATAYMRLAEMADRNTLLDLNEDVDKP